MSDNNKQSVIANAHAIIQRFGGIRPMSKATGIPVTTIQGWKKRDIIPATRREEIRHYAQGNNIALDDLLDATTQTVPVEDSPDPRDEAGDQGDDTLNLDKAQAVHSAGSHHSGPDAGQQKHPSAEGRVAKYGGAQSAFMGQMAMIMTTVLVAVLVLGAFMFWPDLKKVPEQNKRISKLERNVEQIDRDIEQVDRDVKQVKGKQGYLDSMVPDNLKSQLSGLHNKTRELSQKTGQLSRKMANISADDVTSYAEGMVSKENIKKLKGRVSKLEQQMRQYADNAGMGNIRKFMNRLNAMQNIEGGREQLSQAASQLYELADNAGGNVGQLKIALMAQQGEDDALGKTLEGVQRDNLKAAALLTGFANLRGALARDRSSFQQDLALMKRLIDDDNKELNAAIDRLSPEAKDGVLTPSGLSREFRSLAGEIATAKLRGKDVSITDKAKARLSEIVTVKKDGREITGTKEHKLVAEAKSKLDEGDVDGAISTLHQLDGRAAKKARPFIEKAEATAMAKKVKAMLGNQVMQHLGGSASSPAPATGPAASDLPEYDADADMRFRPEHHPPDVQP